MRTMLHAYRAVCTFEAACRPLLGSVLPRGPVTLEETVRYGRDKLAQSSEQSLVLYAGTIGEFNAVRRFIEAYRAAWPDDRLILLSGQDLYADALHEARPDAIVALPLWREPALLDRFVALARPRLVAFAEGPSLHARFPVRLELPLSAACLYHHLPLIVLNARVYEANLASRIDRIEHAAFRRLHRDAVAHWFAPGETFRRELEEAGAQAERITVVGDLKFDNAAAPPEAPSPALASILRGFQVQGALLVVGGSVNAIDDQISLISAWHQLREAYPAARLVIAPRYLQDLKVLRELCAYLDGEGISYQLRSTFSGEAVEADVLIIDVFGELRYYYGQAAICYVGRNHGVLEPLQYRKPTVVADDWRRDHPSFPLYDTVVRSGAVAHVTDKTALGAAFIRILRDAGYAERLLADANRLIESHAGAAGRIMDVIEPILAAGSKGCRA